MSELAILVPVLRRPHRVAPLLESIERSTPARTTLFVCDPDDVAEIAAIESEGASHISIGGNYAAKIRAGVQATTEPLIFTGADDLEFLPGWFEAARGVLEANGSHVVGINDLIPRSRAHATHFLMTRDYAQTPTIDGGEGPFHAGYSHWFCDDELIATATHRGVYAYAEKARVRHLHPMVGGPDDATYRQGRANRRADRRRFHERSPLWT